MLRKTQVWLTLRGSPVPLPIRALAVQFGVTKSAMWSTLVSLRNDGSIRMVGSNKSSRWIALDREPQDWRGRAPGSVAKYWRKANVPANKDKTIPSRKSPRKRVKDETGFELWQVWGNRTASPLIAVPTSVLQNGDKARRGPKPVEHPENEKEAA